jgi:hypothetical protein
MNEIAKQILKGLAFIVVTVCFVMAVVDGGDRGLHREFLATFPDNPLFQEVGEQQWQKLKIFAQKEGLPFEKLIRDSMVITQRVKAEYEARVRQNRMAGALHQGIPE